MLEQLLERGVQLMTRLKSKMRNRLMPFSDNLLLCKCAIVEPITDQLKNISQTEMGIRRLIPNILGRI